MDYVNLLRHFSVALEKKTPDTKTNTTFRLLYF